MAAAVVVWRRLQMDEILKLDVVPALREPVARARRVVIKIGTNVVMRDDGVHLLEGKIVSGQYDGH